MALFEEQDKKDIMELMESFSKNSLFELEVVIGESDKHASESEYKCKIRMIRTMENK